jgi:hypothetical protein
LNVVIGTAYANNLVMVIAGNVGHAFLSRLSEEFAFFVPVRILPRVLDNKQGLWVLFAMCFPTDCCPADNATCTVHDLVNDEALYFAVSLDIDVLVVTGGYDGRVKPKHLLIHQQKPQDCRHKL